MGVHQNSGSSVLDTSSSSNTQKHYQKPDTGTRMTAVAVTTCSPKMPTESESFSEAVELVGT